MLMQQKVYLILLDPSCALGAPSAAGTILSTSLSHEIAGWYPRSSFDMTRQQDNAIYMVPLAVIGNANAAEGVFNST